MFGRLVGFGLLLSAATPATLQASLAAPMMPRADLASVVDGSHSVLLVDMGQGVFLADPSYMGFWPRVGRGGHWNGGGNRDHWSGGGWNGGRWRHGGYWDHGGRRHGGNGHGGYWDGSFGYADPPDYRPHDNRFRRGSAHGQCEIVSEGVTVCVGQ